MILTIVLIVINTIYSPPKMITLVSKSSCDGIEKHENSVQNKRMSYNNKNMCNHCHVIINFLMNIVLCQKQKNKRTDFRIHSEV